MSFDTHPDTLVFGTPTELLNTMDERKHLMQSLYGIEDVIFCHFDRDMMNMDWEAFVEDYLVRELHACHLVCGHDYHFGARGFGNAERLTEKCRALGLGCDVIGEVKLDGVTVSSTYLRRLLKEGRMEEAVRFLGHGHIISGIVQHGDSRGHTLGLPTAKPRVRCLPPRPGLRGLRRLGGCGRAWPVSRGSEPRRTPDGA